MYTRTSQMYTRTSQMYTRTSQKLARIKLQAGTISSAWFRCKKKHAAIYSALWTGTTPKRWSTSPSTLYRYSLTTTAQYHTINHFDHNGDFAAKERLLYTYHIWPSQPGSAPRFCTGYNETISRKFLVQGNFKLTQSSREQIQHCWESNSQPLAP